MEAYAIRRYAQVWQHWARSYDYKHVKGARIARIVEETGGEVPIALELGVGPGAIAAALSRRGMKIIGVDLSPDALEKAKQQCRMDNVSLLRGSGFALPFGDRTLALIYASQVLHLFDDEGRLELMREAHRVLQPGGRFLFDMKNALSHPWRVFSSSRAQKRINFPPQSKIITSLQDAGFSTVTRRAGVLPGVHWARVPNIGAFRMVAHTTFFVATRAASEAPAAMA